MRNSRACLTTQVASAIAAGLPYNGVLINYTRSGTPFTNHLTLEPLCLGPESPGSITHYVGTLRASPYDEPLSPQTILSARLDGMHIRMDMAMDAQAPLQNGAFDVGDQSLACRRLATELLATNGCVPISLPQLLTAMTSLLPLVTATALVELVGAVLRNEVGLCAAEFDGALRILLGSHISILTDLVGWLRLLAPEPADVGTMSLESTARTGKVEGAHIGTTSIDDVMTLDLDLGWSPPVTTAT